MAGKNTNKLASLVILLAIVACTPPEPTATPTAVPTPTPTPGPERVAFPFSWDEHGFRVMVLELRPVPPGKHQGTLLEGKHQFAVRIQYENLLRETNRIPQGGVGLDRFRLKTDTGNVYDPKYVGGSPMYGSFDPRATLVTDTYAFNIRADEAPTELLGYDCPKPTFTYGCSERDLRLVYVFERTRA